MRPFRSVSLLWLFAIGLALPQSADAARRNPRPTPRVENCVITLESLHVFTSKTIKYVGRCPGGLAEGVLSVTGHSSDPNDAYTITSTFVHGRPTGRTNIVRPDGTNYTGTIDLAGNSTGTVSFADGRSDQFEFRGTVLWRGISTDPTLDPSARYYLRSHEVPASMYQADVAGHPPPEALFSPSLAQGCPTFSLSRGKPATQRTACNGTALGGIYTVPFVSIEGKQAALTATFADGRPGGFGRIAYTGAGTFYGTVTGFARSEGITKDDARGTERGTYQNDRLYDGSFVPQGLALATVVLRYRHGKLVGPNEAAQRALLARIPQGQPMPRMARLNIEGSTCYASLPTNEYKVSAAEMPGSCRDGYYTGKAKFTLTPLRAGLSTQTVSIAFDHGLPLGDARVSLPSGQTFVGSLENWRPANGEMSQALGGGNYEVLAYSGGTVASRRQEHRELSQGDQMGQQLLGALLGGLTRSIQSGMRERDQSTTQSTSPSYQSSSTGRSEVPQSTASACDPRYRACNINSRPSQSDQQTTQCGIYTPDGQYVASSDPAQCAASRQERDRITAANCGYADSRTVDPSYCTHLTGVTGIEQSVREGQAIDRANAETARARQAESIRQTQESDAYWKQKAAQDEAAHRAAVDAEQQQFRQQQAASQQAEADRQAAQRAAQQERDRITAANCGYADSRTVDPRYCAQSTASVAQMRSDVVPPMQSDATAKMNSNAVAPMAPSAADLAAQQEQSRFTTANNSTTQYAVCTYNTTEGRQYKSTDPTVCTTTSRMQQEGQPIASRMGANDTLYATLPSAPQPVAIPASAPASQPANTQQATYQTSQPAASVSSPGGTPSTPTGTSPGNPSEYSPTTLGSSITFTWITNGASYYEFGITNLSTGGLVVDTQVPNASYSANLPSGRYRWNVAACNPSNKCSSYTTRLYFNVGNAQPSSGSSSSATGQSLAIPSAPTGLTPTNEGVLAVPMTIGWNWPQGATYFKVAIRDVTTNTLPVNDAPAETNSYRTPALAAGHQYRWDVIACNSTGQCSGRSDNRNFSTAPATKEYCTIEVRFKPVYKISNHAFIVTSDKDSTTYFRGGPASRESALSDRVADNTPNFIFGYIVTELGSYTPGTIDWIQSPSGTQVIAREQGNCDIIDRELSRHLLDIERSKINYNPFAKNSNSVVSEVLKRAGYPSVYPVVQATAWGSQLP